MTQGQSQERKLVKAGWPFGMRCVLEHVLYLPLSDARGRQFGQFVTEKKRDLRGLKTRRGLAAEQFAEEEELVGVYRDRRMGMFVAVKYRCQFARHHVESGFFLHFPHH